MMAPLPAVSIVMPAYRALSTIARAVRSVCEQDHGDFELIVVADDGADYEKALIEAGIRDERIRHLASGRVGGGSPPARNLGLDAARHRFAAILDADDRFRPGKLQSMLEAARGHGLASCALNVTTPEGTPLRTVGAGPDRLLEAGAYKFTNFSMDSMLVYDRGRADPRFDPSLPCMTDLDFLLKLLAAIPACYHIGTPLHDYVKMPVSVSNGPGVSERMIATKALLRAWLADGHYPMADPQGRKGMDRFLELSLLAEKSFDPARCGDPPLFENHIEPILAARAAPAAVTSPSG